MKRMLLRWWFMFRLLSHINDCPRCKAVKAQWGLGIGAPWCEVGEARHLSVLRYL